MRSFLLLPDRYNFIDQAYQQAQRDEAARRADHAEHRREAVPKQCRAEYRAVAEHLADGGHDDERRRKADAAADAVANAVAAADVDAAAFSYGEAFSMRMCLQSRSTIR